MTFNVASIIIPAVFLTCTNQKMPTDNASVETGECRAQLCMLEGFTGYAEQANVRVRRHNGRNVPHATAVEPKVGA